MIRSGGLMEFRIELIDNGWLLICNPSGLIGYDHRRQYCRTMADVFENITVYKHENKLIEPA